MNLNAKILYTVCGTTWGGIKYCVPLFEMILITIEAILRYSKGWHLISLQSVKTSGACQAVKLIGFKINDTNTLMNKKITKRERKKKVWIASIWPFCFRLIFYQIRKKNNWLLILKNNIWYLTYRLCSFQLENTSLNDKLDTDYDEFCRLDSDLS